MSEQPSLADVNNERTEKVGKNAAVIGGITLLSRIAGFGRILVLTWALGMGGVLDVYNTANRAPNILYEIVAGGALASLVVPLLAAPLARKEPEVVKRTASGLMTWSLVILVPMGAAVALLAEPIFRLLATDAASTADIAMGTRMLQVFAPQLPLYGVGVVLTGILHAHRRFAWPALAPLLSSLTVISAYVIYGVITDAGLGVAQVPLSHELILSIGTTLATVVMTFCLLIPMRQVGLRLRPTLRFGGGDVGRNVRTMAVAGGISIASWQISLLLILALTNAGPTGTVGLFQIALALYMLPWGVFAMPLSLSSYPALSEAYGTGDEDKYGQTLSLTTRRLLLFAALGAAAMVGLAEPLARVFDLIGTGGDVGFAVAPVMAATITALGPGLLGFSLYPLLTRALFARGEMVSAAYATVLGWGGAYIAAIVGSQIAPVADRAIAVAWGNTVGMTVLGVALLFVVWRKAGRMALWGTWRAGGAAIAAATVAVVAGRAATAAWGSQASLFESIVAITVGGTAILLVFGVVSYLIDKRDVRPAVKSVLARLRRGR